MAKIIITRSSEYINRIRGIRIFLNGQEMGKIANGQTRDIELPSGSYVLKAKIDWCGSKDFTFNISENETKTVMLSSFGYSWDFFPIFSVSVFLVAILQFVFKIDYAGWLGLPLFLIMAYYFTIGRNNYLVVKEHEVFS